MKRIVFIMIIVGMGLAVFAGITSAEKSKILFVDSYHAGYEWSDGITNGILNALNVQMNGDNALDHSASAVELKILRMDTKRNTSEEFCQQAALKAKADIEAWQPNVIIASDDNASKYLIAPYFKETETPVVFCGVNWDASEYGFPARNVTGMLEVELLPQLLEALQKYAKGNRIGYIASDHLTNRKQVANFEKTFDLTMNAKFVNSYEEWQNAFTALQDESDLVLLGVAANLSGWDNEQVIQFVETATRIPSGCFDPWMAPLALIGYTKIPEEQGEWAAQTALQILDGASPADIPVVMNTKGQIYLNMRLAEKLGVRFPLTLVKHATLIK